MSRPRFARRVRGRRALTLAFAPRLIIQLFRECQIPLEHPSTSLNHGILEGANSSVRRESKLEACFGEKDHLVAISASGNQVGSGRKKDDVVTIAADGGVIADIIGLGFGVWCIGH